MCSVLSLVDLRVLSLFEYLRVRPSPAIWENGRCGTSAGRNSTPTRPEMSQLLRPDVACRCYSPFVTVFVTPTRCTL